MDKYWKRIFNVSTVTEFNELLHNGEFQDIILVSEAVADKKIVEIANRVIESRKRLVLIAGPSSSGKTSFAKKLRIQLRAASRKPVYIGTDDYYKDRENVPLGEDGKPDFECLEAIDTEGFSRDLTDLMDGKTINVRTFDFVTGKGVYCSEILKVDAGQPIIVEGLHSLNDELTPGIGDDKKFRIYIKPLSQLDYDNGTMIDPNDLRKIRRVVRDSEKRNASAEQTLEMWDKITAGEQKYIEPYKDKADIVYDSSLPYELAVLKKDGESRLSEVPLESPYYEEAQRLLGILSLSLKASDVDAIDASSLVREFIGGSIL